MSFVSPVFLLLIPLAPAAFILRQLYYKSKKPCFTLPLDFWGEKPEPGAPLSWRLVLLLSALFYCISWSSLCFAAAGPAVKKLGLSQAGSDKLVMFALDLSPSMAARDIEPNRLAAAKQLIKSFVVSEKGAAGAKVGISAFGADTALVCPPTSDYAILLERLEALEPGILGDGTALGLGLSGAIELVKKSGAEKTALVLLSDGEDNIGIVHPMDAAESIAASGSSFLLIGLGTRGEVPLTYRDPVSGLEQGGIYRSGFDISALASLADRAGGVFRLAMDNSVLEQVGLDMVKQAGSEADNKSSLLPDSRHVNSKPFFVSAMIFAALAWLLKVLLGGLV